MIHPHRNAHSYQEWGCASPRMRMCLTGNAQPHWEWGCASPGMGMHLTRKEDVPHRECTSSPRMHILTGNAHSLYRVGQEALEAEILKLFCTSERTNYSKTCVKICKKINLFSLTLVLKATVLFKSERVTFMKQHSKNILAFRLQ